jgi:hypothetical protein
MNNYRQHLLWPLSPNMGRKVGIVCYLLSSWNALRPGTGLHPSVLVVMSLAFHFHCYPVGYLGSGLAGPPDPGNEQLERQTPECAQQQQAGNSGSVDCASSHSHCSSYHLSLHALDSSVMQKGILPQVMYSSQGVALQPQGVLLMVGFPLPILGDVAEDLPIEHPASPWTCAYSLHLSSWLTPQQVAEGRSW